MDYLVIIEKTASGFSGYAPDLPGCIATASTQEQLRGLMREGIEFHIEGLRLEGHPVPAPSTAAFFYTVIDTGRVSGETAVERIYDIRSFAARVGASPSTVRVYAHRYHIGRKMGRGWVFTEKDVGKVPTWTKK